MFYAIKDFVSLIFQSFIIREQQLRFFNESNNNFKYRNLENFPNRNFVIILL